MSQWKSIAEIAADIQTGKVTAVSLVEQALKTIEEKKEYNAIISVIKDRSLQRAHQIDQQVKNGEQIGKLAGVPFIAKDNFLTFGSETTAASNILRGFEAPYQATVIEQLEAEGAICTAKANLDAFGHGGSTENSDFVVTKNPHDKTRVPGGSSGGPAAAVILDMAPFAIATDTGGSIRQPASFTGAVGYRPTYGLVSRSGVVAMASSTDTIGPITKNVTDAALIIDILAGKDRLDSTTIDREPEGYGLEDTKAEIKTAKIGVIKEYMGEGTDEEVRKSINDAIGKLKTSGAEIKEVSLPSLDLALAAYYIIVPAEISSNLSRYDGQRYGYSYDGANNLTDSYNWSRSEGFGNEAKRRIMIGTYVLSSGYFDAYYKTAQKLRTKIIDEFNEIFRSVDFLVGPVAPTPAFHIGENSDPLKMYLQDTMTVAVSLVGIPAISIPASPVKSGLPVGLQIMAPQRMDRSLLNMAHKAERVLA